MGSFSCSLSRDLVAGDNTVCALFGLPPSDELRPVGLFLDRIHPDDRLRVENAIRQAHVGRIDYHEEFRVSQGEGWRWLSGRGRVIQDASGDTILVGINWDISHRRAEQERLTILAQEMDHRVKNAFSVINALIRLGSRSAGSVRSFADTLMAQVRAMADAHRMSADTARHHQGGRVRMVQIVRMAVAPWLTGDAEQVVLAERYPAELPLEQVSAFAMLVYELATNAAKYGALGAPDGRLHVAIDRSEDDGVLFTWDERVDGDVPRRANEERQKGLETGFGTTLLTHCAATLKARFKRELRPQGLLVELRLP